MKCQYRAKGLSACFAEATDWEVVPLSIGDQVCVLLCQNHYLTLRAVLWADQKKLAEP